MPKLTINYGLRWDLEQMQHEQHDRVTQFSPTVANPSAGGLLGGTEYEGYGAGRCNCSFEKFYPWMIQPRLGVNYQLDTKTVLHVGTGLYSGQQLFMNEIGYSNQGFGFNQVTLNSPSPGIAAGLLSNGIPYNPADLTATHFDPGAFPNLGQTNSPPPLSFRTMVVHHVFSKRRSALSVPSPMTCRLRRISSTTAVFGCHLTG